MIHIRDATMLALTKLRTRKVRLTVTIVISGLLFSALAGASFVARGAMSSIQSFSKEGLGERFIVQGYPQTDQTFFNNQEVMDRAVAIHKDTVARKKTEAKRLGITYNAEIEQSPTQEYDTPGGKQKFLNTEHAAAKQAIQEYQATHPAPDHKLFAQTAKKYNAISTFESKMLPYTQGGGQLQVLKDGKENFEAGGPSKGMNGPPTGTDSFITSWSTMSTELLEPFILPGQNLKTGTDGSIPIIVPRSAAQQLLGLKDLPSSASPSDRLERTKEIRQKAPDIRFSVCYRNAASANLIQQAISTQQEIDRNKGKKDYQRPSLIYGLPKDPCGSVQITRDVRTKEEKNLAAKQQQFEELFGAEPAAQSTMTFRIVGIAPDMSYGAAFSVGEIIRSLLTSSLGQGWFSPIEQLDSNPLMNTLFNRNVGFFPSNYYAEFSTASDARHFIDKENCTPDYGLMASGPEADVLKPCRDKGQNFSLNPYGSNSLALETAKKTFGKIFWYAALVISVIAGIIMMGTVGRMIADSRRETAVFRAIGAKKLDIAQIYVLYVICLSLLISLFALLAGLILALVAHDRWSADATIQAITAYNSQDLDKTFSLYTFYLPDILLLIGLALAAGLLSAVFPLFRNLRRNPIRDMRDDT